MLIRSFSIGYKKKSSSIILHIMFLPSDKRIYRSALLAMVCFTCLCCAASFRGDQDNCIDMLISKLDKESRISRNELERCLKCDFSDYDRKFYGYGEKINNKISYLSIYYSMKKNGIYHIAVIKNGKKIIVNEFQQSSRERQPDGYVIWHEVGDAGLSFNPKDSCLYYHTYTYQPFRTDTLKEKFIYSDATIIRTDSIRFCPE
jgi:hypothetical protein